MAVTYDAIVIGAGHNGLTAACYLAKGGLRVLVLERRPMVGGAAVTEEIHPGFRASSASYVVSLLRPEIIADLELARHGLTLLEMGGGLCLRPDGRHLMATGDEAHDRAQYARHSNRDFEAMAAFRADLMAVSDVLRDQMLREPPALGGGLGSLLDALPLANGARKLDGRQRRLMLQLFTTPVTDILDRRFDSEAVKIKMASSATAGTCVALDRPGSAINLLHLTIGEVMGRRGGWALARGGMGAITQAMTACARERGVEIRTEAEVETVLVEDGRATGVRLKGGGTERARVVLSNCDPKRTFLDLVQPGDIDPDFAADIAQWRQNSGTFRMNLALSGAPVFTGIAPEQQRDALGCSFTAAPGYRTFDDAFRSAERGEIPEAFVISGHLPTVFDDSLAPPGCHILSLLCQHAPYALSGGRSWDDHRDATADRIVAQLEEHMPGLSDLVIGRQVFSPWDLEQVFGLTGGDVYHGKLDADQMFSLRPHPDAARYATPLRGLYLCGAGAHPGGGVSGAPGHNAARRVLKDIRSLPARP